MTPAEWSFKRCVRALVKVGIYPGPVQLRAFLGRPRGSMTINGRQTRWRRAVLRQMGWKERRRWVGHRYRWIPPKSWVPFSRRPHFSPRDEYSRG